MTPELPLPPESPVVPTPPGPPAVLLFRGRGFISSLIRFQTRGAYSHAALMRPDGMIIESWPGKGVQLKVLKDWAGIDTYAVPLTPMQWRTALAFAEQQIGSGYDYWGVIRFIDRRNMPDNKKWFCSELVFAALAFAGVRLFERIDAGEVSPGLLGVSPMLTPVGPPTVLIAEKAKSE